MNAAAAHSSPDQQLAHDLAALVRYARDRLLSGEGAESIRSAGFDLPDLLGIYHAGYLGERYQQALGRHVCEPLRQSSFEHCLVFPAYDPHGLIVDLHGIRLDGSQERIDLWSPPRGLLAPRILTACSSIAVVDTVDALRNLARAGRHNALLVREPDDIRRNAEIFRAGKVCETTLVACLEEEALRDALQVCGISVKIPGTPPAAVDTADPIVLIEDDDPGDEPVSPPLKLVRHDTDHHQAIFTAGDVTLVCEVPFDDSSLLEVLIRRDGSTHRDRFDLAMEAQRRRFAQAAGRRLKQPADQLQDLIDGCLDAVRQLRDQQEAPPAAEPSADTSEVRAAAQKALTSPALFGNLLDDLEATGWVGDDQGKRLGILTLVSRQLERPIWLTLKGHPSITAEPLALLMGMMPPEWSIHASRLTEAALYHQEADAFRHRLLVLDTADGLRGETMTALQVLQTRGGLAIQQAERDLSSGRLITRTSDARGPIALLAAGSRPSPLDGLSICVHLDETAEQTARVMATFRQQRANGQALKLQPIQDRWRAMLRQLDGLPVHIPYADRILMPSTRPEHRRDQRRFFSLIEASALLHQHQRRRIDGTVIAAEEDFHVALQAATGLLGVTDDGINQRARPVLQLMATKADHAWTVPELTGCFPHLSRATIRRALDDLEALDLVSSSSKGRGRANRIYQLNQDEYTEHSTAIRLLPEDQILTDGQVNWPGGQLVANKVANINPVPEAG